MSEAKLEMQPWQAAALAAADEVFGCGPGFVAKGNSAGEGVCSAIYDSITGAEDADDMLGNLSRSIEELQSVYDAISDGVGQREMDAETEAMADHDNKQA